MSVALSIYSTQAAPPPLAGWLQRVLHPVLAACRFEHGLPVEVRPTGSWGGWCSGRAEAPDRRIALTKKICFWPAEKIVSVYLHEAAHRFLECREVPTHGAEFFCLNAILLLRSAAFFRLDPLFQLDLYDLQEQPAELDEPNWRGVVLGWALPTATELAASDVNAEALADAVCERWQLFLYERENARLQTAQKTLAARKKAAAVEGQIEDLKSSIFLWRALSSVGFLFFLSVCIFVF